MSTKERLERFLSDTPIKPILRTHVNGVEVFVADGFITPDMYRGADIKFGVSPDKLEHPEGCWATVWHAEGNPGGLSGVAYYKKLHDIDHLALNERLTARVRSTLVLAEQGLRKAKIGAVRN